MNDDEYKAMQAELLRILGSNWKTRPETLTKYGASWGKYVEVEQAQQKLLYEQALKEIEADEKATRDTLLQKHIYSTHTDKEKLEALAGLSMSPKYQLENSNEIITHVHNSIDCEGPCPIHKRSDHPMRGWPQHWRNDARVMERMCSHGVGHPDPDDKTKVIHGCDGCCAVVRSAAAVDITELFVCPQCDYLGTELEVNDHRMAEGHAGGANRKR